MMRGIQGQVVFLQPDLEQILIAIATTDAMAKRVGSGSTDYHLGFAAAILAVATAIGVDATSLGTNLYIEVRQGR